MKKKMNNLYKDMPKYGGNNGNYQNVHTKRPRSNAKGNRAHNAQLHQERKTKRAEDRR